jgi:cyclopropane-fatty-acyl-phospholipid synthase
MNHTTISQTETSGSNGQQRFSARQRNDGPSGGGARQVGRLDRWLLERLLHFVGQPRVAVELWDGREYAANGHAPTSRVRIGARRTLWKLAWDPWYQFGEAYARGELDVEGPLDQLLLAVYRNMTSNRIVQVLGDRWARLLHPRYGNSLSRSRKNVHHHYDLGNDFYRLWLDERMLYTCAYYPVEQMSLEDAQLAKMDHVCRKLRLQPGETVVEAGCGWGALALHMARHYDVHVVAYNISPRQIAYAREQAVRQGLSERVEFVQQDWREIDRPCDAFVSIGMLEHVGPRNYGLLGKTIDRCLRRKGRGLLHTIGQNRPRPVNPWIERRIFPGGYPPSLGEIQRVLEPYELSVLDVENLRLHYAQTLRHWWQRFEAHAEQVRSMFDEDFVRVWRLYLCGSIAAFEMGSLQLFQVLFARPLVNDIPRTRQHLYESPLRTSSELSPQTGNGHVNERCRPR